MKRANVSFTFFDDIVTVYGLVEEECPLKISFPSSFFMYAEPEAVSLIFIGGSGERFIAKLLSFENNTGIFELLENPGEIEKNRGLLVDYKYEFTAAIVREHDNSRYISICREINSSLRRKLLFRNQQLLLGEESDNYEAVGFLLEMNSKLDEILSILKPSSSIEGSFNVRGVALCNSYVTFYSEKDLKDVSNIFVRLMIKDGNDNSYFASLGSLSLIKKNNDGSGIYKSEFSNLEEDIKDAIVRFLFIKEREILKEARF